MTFRVLVQGLEHYWQDDFNIIANEIAEIFVVPEIKRSLSDLEMRASDGFCELIEKRLLHFGKLSWIHDFEYVFNFIEKHDFFRAVDFRPVA